MPADSNQPWDLESFVDSFIVELDKAQDTLAVKGLTRKLTYSVKDVALDLNIFPRYDAGKIRFVTAQPGESSPSRMSIQLGSISERQIKDVTRGPVSKDDVSIDLIEELDDETKDSLRKVGVTSADDLERLERRNVDVDKVLKDKTRGKGQRSYKDLANLINKARRKRLPPQIDRVGVAHGADGPELRVEGRNLVMATHLDAFPLAALDGGRLAVTRASDRELRLRLDGDRLPPGSHRLEVALDPYALMKVDLQS